jgi:hypothetical protein
LPTGCAVSTSTIPNSTNRLQWFDPFFLQEKVKRNKTIIITPREMHGIELEDNKEQQNGNKLFCCHLLFFANPE